MKLVIIESPYAGDIEKNVAYARDCVRDSLMRGEAPYASHLLYTQPNILDDYLYHVAQWQKSVQGMNLGRITEIALAEKEAEAEENNIDPDKYFSDNKD